MQRPLVSLLTDFGARDASAAICRAVILGICPEVELLDITHEVRKFSIRDGALALWCALPYLPRGVHVGVVDPGVGTARLPIAIRVARGDVLVGPDNGLLPAGADRLGGIEEVRELANPEYRLPVVTSSFHGRDIFAPAAAHLAAGVSFASLGPRVEVASLAPSPLPAPVPLADGGLRTEIVYVDTFGNVKLSALIEDLHAALGESPGGRFGITIDNGPRVEVPWVGTFGEVARGQALLYEDSYGRLCVAVNQGSAATQLGLVDGMTIDVRPA
jgi:hypothetical protein